jgi:hypothetical protein
MTPQRIAATIYSALKQRGLELSGIDKAETSRKVRQPGSGAMGKAHMVQEYFFEIADPENPNRAILVSVRIADRRQVRPERDEAIPEQFDASGIPFEREIRVITRREP